MPFVRAVPRLLVIDDNYELASLLADYFTSLDYAVDVASAGAAGLELARVTPPDVVILDMLLPGPTSGMQVLNTIRTDAPDTPVIVITGTIDNVAATRTLAAGAFACVMKPFDIETLTELVVAAAAKTSRPD